MRQFCMALICGLGFLGVVARADGPADNQVATVRAIPPLGIKLSAEQEQELTEAVSALETHLAELASSRDPFILKYLPDAEIFARAVRLALRDQGFYDPADFDRAKELLKEGESRAAALAAHSAPWRFYGFQGKSFETVRGFRSQLDGTAQPYGVVFSGDSPEGRADVWCRGRSEKGLELQFISTRMKNRDPEPARGVLMIHPFGRYCNANKLAGEVDTLEALEHAMSEYPIDPQRVSIRGFSMGGAAAWHLAVHYPDRWFAANPGAGFSETPDFLKVFQSEELKPFWFEQKLWQCYDCPVWARNLRMLPTIAYSGAIDKQKQAADIMAKACWELPESERFELTHIVAPHTAHQVSPAARNEIERRLQLLDQFRPKDSPRELVFTTTTLRYPRMHWLTVDALDEHWVPSTIRASRSDNHVDVLMESGIRQFTIDLGVNDLLASPDTLTLSVWTHGSSEDTTLKMVTTKSIARRSDRTWGVTFRRTEDRWEHVSPLEADAGGLRKRHLLQGPIDDAFMAPFLFVRPTNPGYHAETQAWVQSEMDRAVREWGRQMRGDVRIKTPEEITSEDLLKYHLVLWGDPRSNATIAQVLEKLPIQWSQDAVQIRGKTFSAKSHVPLLIYPNPLAPDRYVVLNSSFTYREYDYLNNARQVPKLPDWAVLDISTPPDARWPGRIAEADFFGEQWEVKGR